VASVAPSPVNRLRNVRVVPYRVEWPALFSEEAERLRAVFGPELIALHHIGSTSVPGLPAKPIIDMLPEVRDIRAVDGLNEALAGLGYLARGEYGIPGRRYFTKGGPTHRTHHMHCFEHDDPGFARHLAFRDYLIAHPEEAEAYGRLKLALAQQFPTDIVAYMDGKDAFIKEVERKALAWRAGGGNLG
jgi:GrpB-like predicted nucleotidyltransferase (UPF0157 family)